MQRETDQAESRSEQRAHEVASAAASATPDGQSAHKAAELQSHRSNSPSDSTVGETPGDKEKKKKKKKPDELDAEGRQVLLKKCEIRGEPTEGEKMTAFAKRAKKIEVAPQPVVISALHLLFYCLSLMPCHCISIWQPIKATRNLLFSLDL